MITGQSPPKENRKQCCAGEKAESLSQTDNSTRKWELERRYGATSPHTNTQ